MYPMPDSCFIGADPAHHDGFCRQEFSAVRDCDGVVYISKQELEPGLFLVGWFHFSFSFTKTWRA
jgi:hypothetical protein